MCDGCKNTDGTKCGENTCVDTPVTAQAQEDKAMANRDKVFFLQSPCGKSFMTAACHVSEDQRRVFIGLAFAAKKHFKRQEGRKIAFGRLEKGSTRFFAAMPFNGRSSDSLVVFFNEIQRDVMKLRNDLKVCEELYYSQAAQESESYRNKIVEQWKKTKKLYDQLPSAWRKLQMRNDQGGITLEPYKAM